MQHRRAAYTVILAAIVAATAIAISSRTEVGIARAALTVASASELWMEGKSTVHDWESRTKTINVSFTPATGLDDPKKSVRALILAKAVHGAVIQIRRIKEQVDDRAAKQPALTSQAAALNQRLTAIEDEIYQGRTRSGQDLLNFPIRLNNRMAALRSSVEGGDAKPTAGAYQVFKELSGDLDHQMALLDAAIKTHLAQFNRALGARKLEPIAP